MSWLPSRKRKGVVCLTLTLTVGLIIATAWSSRNLLIEIWYVHNLASSDVETKRDAIERLGRLRSRKAIPDLEALVHDDHELAVPALVSLVRIGPAATDALRKLLKSEAENKEIFDAAIAPIGELGATGIPGFLPLLHKQPFSHRLSWAGRALLAIGDPAAGALTELLLEGVTHGHVNYKAQHDTITILARLEPTAEINQALSHALLRSRNSSVRRKAASALGKLGSSSRLASPSLLKALADKDQNVADAAAHSLSRIGASAIPLLALHLHDDNRATRMGAIFALGEIRSPGAVPHLVEVLKDEDWRIRLHAIKAIRKIGKYAKAAIPALREQLSAPHPHVRNAAARTLKEIADNDA